uniref:Uncharacterized protein n=1 Tax=Panagrolaimus sp. ES5 TaxID=591445 RepID=A0AC34GWM7_9BILA
MAVAAKILQKTKFFRLMKKGHIPRGPPRFGKRGGANAPSNHLRLRQFSLYGPMMHLLPRNNEMQEFNPYGY